MHKIRKINRVLKARPSMDGAGVHLRRVFGFHEVPDFDPFLMMDDFGSDKPEHYLKGFPWHPHRGIETITYLIRGSVEHGDSLGNEGVISEGDVQWMTAGSGIVHQEMPKGDASGAMFGFQLWANLPAAQKMMPPRYRDISAEQIPELVDEHGIRVKIIAGRLGDVRGPVDDIAIDPGYFDCTVPAGQSFIHETKADYTALLYVIEGVCECDGSQIDKGKLVHFTKGDRIELTASDAPLRFLLLTGKPLNEPVVWGGPIVMNTQAELDLAFHEYKNGTFIKNHS